MATSSITKNFVISGQEQVEKFVNILEESYQESLYKKQTSDLNIIYLRDWDEIENFIQKKEEKLHGQNNHCNEW